MESPWRRPTPFTRRLPVRLQLLAGALAWLVVLLLVLRSGAVPAQPLAPRSGTPLQPMPDTSEALARRSIWNRPESYPLERSPTPGLYRPSAPWIGRLILPDPSEAAHHRGDWVWIELEQTPPDLGGLIGRKLRLSWSDTEHLQRLVQAVTVDVRLGAAADQLADAGNVVPVRLDGRRVGPLQTLAGARPLDDITVALEGVLLAGDELKIERPPVQITGRWQGLVTVLPHGTTPLRAADPLLPVRHFNPVTARFDGAEERIRIPLLPPDRFGRTFLDPEGLQESPLNRQGWLIQGAPGPDGVFTVQALLPAALLALEPQALVRGTTPALAHIASINWSDSQTQRGSLHSTALLPDRTNWPDWREGDRALLIHLFGGIGGVDGEPSPAWTTTGHFAFGEASVVRDGFSGKPRLGIRYHQIYANNPNGIVAGTQDWSAYAGNLQRGWIGTRPFSDLLVPVDGPVLDALGLQAEILSARYRSGDGAGVALVTPSTSCVQDSSQALWIAMQQLRMQRAIRASPADEQRRLVRLADALDRMLAPFGLVRDDWRHNALRSLGESEADFRTDQGLRNVLLSWRSMLPRRAHDGMAVEFLRSGFPLWVLRTNQIPGNDPALAPIAATTLLGRLPLAGILLNRIGDGLFPPPGSGSGRLTLLTLALYAPLALRLGRRSGLLPSRWHWPAPWQLIRRAACLLVMPALVEEFLFRLLVIPTPTEGVPAGAWAGWIALSIGLFVLYHPLATRLWYPQGRALFDQPAFLIQCALLGLACALVYGLTGSLWSAVLIHWLAVLVWLECLEGRTLLGASTNPAKAARTSGPGA